MKDTPHKKMSIYPNEDEMSFPLDLRYQICLQPIELPVFDVVALELLQLLTDPDAEIDDFIALINKDQALAIQILKLANSPAYAGRTTSETIKESVSRLGINQITNIAMAASQAALHVSGIPLVNSFMRDLWEHSYACAIGCRSLALSTGYKELADHAYLAGLLHDIGKLYLLKAMEQISLHKAAKFVLNHATLLEVFSDMHVELGCRLMWHWGIPSTYCNIVANHHSEHTDSHDTLLSIVRLVNFQSTQCDLNYHPHRIQPKDVAGEANILKVSEEAFEQLENDMKSHYA